MHVIMIDTSCFIPKKTDKSITSLVLYFSMLSVKLNHLFLKWNLSFKPLLRKYNNYPFFAKFPIKSFGQVS